MTYKGGPDAAAVRIPRAPAACTDSDRGLARISRGLEFASRRRLALAHSRDPPHRAPASQRDAETLRRFESMNTGGNPEVAKLLQEMREHTEALAKQRKHEDPACLSPPPSTRTSA